MYSNKACKGSAGQTLAEWESLRGGAEPLFAQRLFPGPLSPACPSDAHSASQLMQYRLKMVKDAHGETG